MNHKDAIDCLKQALSGWETDRMNAELRTDSSIAHERGQCIGRILSYQLALNTGVTDRYPVRTIVTWAEKVKTERACLRLLARGQSAKEARKNAYLEAIN